ncbi:hypothetical protein [Kroppenstedtia sanguinis]|uniref:Uncharacterized protein n=1 Tax=Kroppenstedtia sanguinis TaxID=1380684 RepID=A0ABW4C6R7_9BACL
MRKVSKIVTICLAVAFVFVATVGLSDVTNQRVENEKSAAVQARDPIES